MLVTPVRFPLPNAKSSRAICCAFIGTFCFYITSLINGRMRRVFGEKGQKTLAKTCGQCSKRICAACLASLLTVCSSGYGCYSFKCVSCRKVNTGLIANVNNAVILRGLLNASQAKLKDMREIHDLE